MTTFDFVIRIAAAVFFGFVIGAERQLTGNMAGIRINVLVSMGTCIFVLFSIIMDVSDTTRIAAQIVSGVGFLCSGIIFKDGVQVRGLNTAATIWCTAAIGVLTSSGYLLLASIATGLLLCANLVFRPIAKLVRPLQQFDEDETCYRVTVVCQEKDEMMIRSLMMSHISGKKLHLTNLESSDLKEEKVEIEAKLQCEGRRGHLAAESLVERVSLEEGVTNVGWEIV